jgi:glycosyltransferase involved in cell wall biosynthesis
MNAGIPFVSSNFQLYDELIQKSNAGISVDPLNITEIINAVNQLLGDADYREQLGKNGKLSLEQKYNWQSQSDRLIKVIKSL